MLNWESWTFQGWNFGYGYRCQDYNAAGIKANPSGIIVAHNHPSCNLNLSETDTMITNKIKDAGALMDIQLLDHLIIIPNRDYYSFADNGAL